MHIYIYTHTLLGSDPATDTAVVRVLSATRYHLYYLYYFWYCIICITFGIMCIICLTFGIICIIMDCSSSGSSSSSSSSTSSSTSSSSSSSITITIAVNIKIIDYQLRLRRERVGPDDGQADPPAWQVSGQNITHLSPSLSFSLYI